MEPSGYQRPPYRELLIREILHCVFVPGDTFTPSYALTAGQEKIQFLNFVGTILDIEKIGSVTSLVLDDGTARIIIRIFEDKPVRVQVGETVLVIGKLRLYQQEKYVSPEIIRKIDPAWLRVRAIKLQSKNVIGLDKMIGNETNSSESNPPLSRLSYPPSSIEKSTPSVEADSKIVEEEVMESPSLPVQKIVDLIRRMDHGEGVLVEELLEQSSLPSTEELLQKMLESGDIFQNAPGKVKVL